MSLKVLPAFKMPFVKRSWTALRCGDMKCALTPIIHLCSCCFVCKPNNFFMLLRKHIPIIPIIGLWDVYVTSCTYFSMRVHSRNVDERSYRSSQTPPPVSILRSAPTRHCRRSRRQGGARVWPRTSSSSLRACAPKSADERASTVVTSRLLTHNNLISISVSTYCTTVFVVYIGLRCTCPCSLCK